MSTRNISWGSKGSRCVRLITLPSSCADCLKIWESQPPGNLRDFPGLQWDCFTFTFTVNTMNDTSHFKTAKPYILVFSQQVCVSTLTDRVGARRIRYFEYQMTLIYHSLILSGIHCSKMNFPYFQASMYIQRGFDPLQ